MNEQQVEQSLHDYNWIINEIKRQQEMLSHISASITFQPGKESDIPKEQGETSDSAAQKVIRRCKTASGFIK